MEKKVKTRRVIVVGILFISFLIISDLIIAKQHFEDEFSGILISKRRSPPSAVVFYFEDKLGKHKKAGNGIFESITVGDSIVKKKGERYMYIYKKNKKTYKYYDKVDY